MFFSRAAAARGAAGNTALNIMVQNRGDDLRYSHHDFLHYLLQKTTLTAPVNAVPLLHFCPCLLTQPLAVLEATLPYPCYTYPVWRKNPTVVHSPPMGNCCHTYASVHTTRLECATIHIHTCAHATAATA